MKIPTAPPTRRRRRVRGEGEDGDLLNLKRRRRRLQKYDGDEPEEIADKHGEMSPVQARADSMRNGQNFGSLSVRTATEDVKNELPVVTLSAEKRCVSQGY